MTTPTTRRCCSEYAELSRRGFLTGAAALAGTSTLFGSTLLPSPRRGRGARPLHDGRAVAAGRGRRALARRTARRSAYYAAGPGSRSRRDPARQGRPVRAAPQPRAPAAAVDGGKLAAVQATGLPAPNRSHFAAMEEVEDADPGSSARVGWLNRLIGLDADASPLQAFSVGGGVAPTSLVGPEPFLSAGNVDDMQIAGDDKWDPEGRPAAVAAHPVGRAGSELGGSDGVHVPRQRDFQPVRETSANPANGASYGRGPTSARPCTPRPA